MSNFLSNFTDRFKAKDFHLAPNKKVSTIKAEFKENFGLSLRVYKGKQFADDGMTFAALNRKTRKEIDAQAESLEIKASMTIGDFEKLVDEHFGLTVQVANEYDTYCVGNTYTLGQASRKDDLKNWCKERGFKSIEDWLKSEKCNTLDEYYIRQKKS